MGCSLNAGDNVPFGAFEGKGLAAGIAGGPGLARGGFEIGHHLPGRCHAFAHELFAIEKNGDIKRIVLHMQRGHFTKDEAVVAVDNGDKVGLGRQGFLAVFGLKEPEFERQHAGYGDGILIDQLTVKIDKSSQALCICRQGKRSDEKEYRNQLEDRFHVRAWAKLVRIE